MIIKTSFFSFSTTALLCFMLLVSPVNAGQRDPLQYFFNQFFDELDAELETAKQEGKKGVLLMFEEDDCPFCARMKKTILNQSEVQDYYRENFRIIAIDKENTIEITDFNGETIMMKDFAEKVHRVRATPVFMMFGLDGKKMKGGRYTGAMTSVDEFMTFGRYFAEGINEKTSFTRYKKSLKK
jgi:thioredoxin-related protein